MSVSVMIVVVAVAVSHLTELFGRGARLRVDVCDFTLCPLLWIEVGFGECNFDDGAI